MPTWSEILKELHDSQANDQMPQFDQVRRKYLVLFCQHSGRPAILYATKWTQSDPDVSPDVLSIVDEDLQGLMEVIHGLEGPNLDLILHSPGGSLDAAEAFVTYLRLKFHHIRVIVPQMAMSAATMIACAADEVVLGKHSFLGPIDPQIVLNTPLGQRMVPAQAILDQFDRAKADCQDPIALGAWLPMLNQYGPDLLIQCENALKLSQDLVRGWLETYMFGKDKKSGSRKAAKIAKWLSSHTEFKSHGRHIPRDKLEDHGFPITHLEDDQTTQDLVLSVFHATTHTFTGTLAVKIIENNAGRAFIKHVQRVTFVPQKGPQAGRIAPSKDRPVH